MIMTIKELRKKTNLSQSKFAKKFGIPVGTLAHWEQGVRTPPNYVISMIETILDYEKKNHI
jgi:putative transcriptional regulator